MKNNIERKIDMEKIVLWSTHCPRCKVLETKLKQKNIEYEEINDVEQMKARGFTEVPKLEVNGVVYDFKGAVDWINREV
jgi:glutaredoxin